MRKKSKKGIKVVAVNRQHYGRGRRVWERKRRGGRRTAVQ
jgi:hypothetical protein